MITATVHASAFIHVGATNAPIFARSEVNRTSGNTANGQLKAEDDLAGNQQRAGARARRRAPRR